MMMSYILIPRVVCLQSMCGAGNPPGRCGHRPLQRRGGFHIRPEGLPLPQASAGDQWSPLQNKSSPCTFMQDELWLGRRGSNSRMRESKSRALPLGDGPLLQNGKSACEFAVPDLNGVGDGTRTHDNRNHNPGLYQLSYTHRSNFCAHITVRKEILRKPTVLSSSKKPVSGGLILKRTGSCTSRRFVHFTAAGAFGAPAEQTDCSRAQEAHVERLRPCTDPDQP